MNSFYVFKLLSAPVLCFGLAGCAILPPKLPGQVAPQDARQLDGYLQNIVAAGDPPGLSVVVVKSGRPVYSKAFGYADKPNGTPATVEDRYQLWSITKPVTAVAVLGLAAEGKLKLSDPVVKYVPFFEVQYPDGSQGEVTVGQLLNHSSGLPNTGPEIIGWIHYENDPPQNQTLFLKKILPEYNELDFIPGSEGRYSNIGYIVLAAVIEAVAGTSYAEYMQQSVLKPFAMESTSFGYPRHHRHESIGSHPRDLLSYVVPFYLDMDKTIRERVGGRLYFNRVYSDQRGATGLIGPAADLGRFMTSVMQPDSSFYTTMFKPTIAITESPVDDRYTHFTGSGWFYAEERGRVSVNHGGAGAAFVCMMRLYPKEQLGIIVLANSTYLGRRMGIPIVDAIAGINWNEQL